MDGYILAISPIDYLKNAALKSFSDAPAPSLPASLPRGERGVSAVLREDSCPIQHRTYIEFMNNALAMPLSA